MEVAHSLAEASCVGRKGGWTVARWEGGLFPFIEAVLSSRTSCDVGNDVCLRCSLVASEPLKCSWDN